MIKTILTIALVLTVGIAQAQEEKKERPDKKPEKGDRADKGKGKGKGEFFKKIAGEDGVLTEEEWKNSPMAKRAIEAGKGDMVAARYKKMDGDGDGEVTMEEFAKAAMRGKGKGDKGKGRPPGDAKKKPERKPKADS